MQRQNFYDATWLDRVSHLRDDAEWMRTALAAAESMVVPLWRSRNLIHPGEVPRAALLPLAAATALIDTAETLVLLGVAGGAAHFAVDLSSLDEQSAVRSCGTVGEFAELRSVAALIEPREGALLAYARGILHWHRTHRFCGRCGNATEMRAAGHVRVCTNPECAAQHFPRTDPAIIVVVSKGERVLLGRKSEWPQGMYSALAGFVEPGESLEAAVAREVMEETSICVGEARYHSSQPWPFPASLMLGFHATATSEEIRLNDNELEDARWFTRDELAGRPMGFANRPRSDSIARRLLDDWIGRG